MKAVFDTRDGSGYDDYIAERYHFPARKNYMAVAQAAVGDWILYREPRRNGGRQAYVGAARVRAIEPDPAQPDHAYAYVENYVQFDPPVAFVGGPLGYWETPLREVMNPSLIGQALQGKSLRRIADADFAAIVAAALGETLSPEGLVQYGSGPVDPDVLLPAPTEIVPGEDFVRRIEVALVNRKVRDANFRRLVCRAYNDTCAVTGLRIINGGGRSEVQAAHIWPVDSGGPDVVQNGIALSGTVHWLFDRHLLSIGEDYRLNVSHNKVPPQLRNLFVHQGARINLPEDRSLWPSAKFLKIRSEIANK